MTKSTSTLREGINKILTEHLYTTIVLPDGHPAQTYVDVTDKLLSLFEKYMKRCIGPKRKENEENDFIKGFNKGLNRRRKDNLKSLSKLLGK